MFFLYCKSRFYCFIVLVVCFVLSNCFVSIFNPDADVALSCLASVSYIYLYCFSAIPLFYPFITVRPDSVVELSTGSSLSPIFSSWCSYLLFSAWFSVAFVISPTFLKLSYHLIWLFLFSKLSHVLHKNLPPVWNVFRRLFLSRLHLGPIPKNKFMLLLMIRSFDSTIKSSVLKYESLKALSAALIFGLTIFGRASYLLSIFPPLL